MTEPGILERATKDVEAIFRRAGCGGALHVAALDGRGGFGVRATEAVVPASVVKVQVALEAETWIAEGRLALLQRVGVDAVNATASQSSTGSASRPP